MIEAPALLRSYVQGIRKLSGALSTSLFVPVLPGGVFRPLLIHDGSEPPVPELADLQSAEKFASDVNRDEELGDETRSVAYVPSQDPNCGLVPLPGVQNPFQANTSGKGHEGRRRGDVEAPGELANSEAWIGLRFPTGQGSILEQLKRSNLPSRLDTTDDPVQWWDWLFALGGALASHTSQVSTILRDSITGLPDRKAFEAVLSDQLDRASAKKKPLSLLLINPDQFSRVNESLGRELGDECVQEISKRLRPALRITDLVARYGGVVFAAILVDTPEDEAEEVGQRVMQSLSEEPYLGGDVELDFSIGLSTVAPGGKGAARSIDLVRQTDHALNAAKRAGVNSVTTWHPGLSDRVGDGLDRLSGIFTGNMSKDYRNMALLHDAIDIIALHSDFSDLAKNVVNKLYEAFAAERVGLLRHTEGGDLEMIYGLTRRSGSGSMQTKVETIELEPTEKKAILSAIDGQRVEEVSLFDSTDTNENDRDTGRTGFAAPLIAADGPLGCLFIEGKDTALTLDSADTFFLESLAAQISVALDRSRLAALENSRQDNERRRLRAELSDLRQALQQVKMVYRSSQMEDMVATVRRVAPTDATVLITGESGTGKELLSRTLHELSPRKSRPLVIVDCGAIASTLIESELFGHERGAYTGAQRRRTGRLVEAREGSVLLDEIGELPLETQTKLLRFVQDKQFTTVGGSRPQSVDVRIIAATNRDLAAEVQAGRFREDLYHRLNVVCLQIPPLRERPDDILYLSHHFLELFAVQYQKAARQLTAEAEDVLLRHTWPGNVRELHNRILQSVILSDSTAIHPSNLGFTPSGEPTSATTLSSTSQRDQAKADTVALSSQGSADESDLWTHLYTVLGQQIDQAHKGSTQLRLPLGSWLRDDLLVETDMAVENVARTAAAIIGMPESTFRRRLRRALDHEQAGLATRSESWHEVRDVLHRLALVASPTEEGLLHRTQMVLLREILDRYPSDVRVGSQLLGVSPPTYRLRVKELQPPT